MLAQFDLEPWHVYSASAVAVGWAAVRMWGYYSDKREERRREEAKEQRENRRDESHTAFLERIATASADNAKQSAIMNERIQHICKADCRNFQQKS